MREPNQWRFRGIGSRWGFSAVELLVVMVIIVILIGSLIAAVAGFTRPAGATAYDQQRQTVNNAVLYYHFQHQGEADELDRYPLVNTAWLTNAPGQAAADECGIIDLCELASGRYLSEVPASAVDLGDVCVPDTGVKCDNCDGTADPCSDCDSASHYVWFWNNTEPQVFSVVDANGDGDVMDEGASATGYQGVWPWHAG